MIFCGSLARLVPGFDEFKDVGDLENSLRTGKRPIYFDDLPIKWFGYIWSYSIVLFNDQRLFGEFLWMNMWCHPLKSSELFFEGSPARCAKLVCRGVK